VQGAWLAATWPFVREQLPAAPSTVLEIGCGPLGGFVPALLADGHTAIGVDPAAPDAPPYRQHTFEQLDASSQFQCVVASASLHHVDDVDAVVDRIDRALAPGGAVIVVEWAWERFDEATAQWCFARLAPADHGDHPTWLHRHQERWHASGLSWDEYLSQWVEEHRLHPSDRIIAALDAAFDRRVLIEAPYFFAELADTSEDDERAAIDAGHIRPASVRYAGRSRRA
jgi:SAM-dependent methyltransferase